MQKLIEPLSGSRFSKVPAAPSAQSRDLDGEGILRTPSPTELTSIYGGVANPTRTAPDTPDSAQDARMSPPSQTISSTSANWSPSLQTMLEQPLSSLPRQLLLGGLVFCMAFGAWATFGQIDEVGHAQGRLVPKGEVYKIHPIDSGKIVSIQVKEGQAVKAGQTLIELDTEMAEAEVERLEQLLSSEKIQLSQMQGLIERTRDEGHIRGEIAIADAQAQMAAIAQAKAKADAQKMAIAQAKANTATNQKLLTQLHTDEMAYKARMDRLKPLVQAGAIATEQMFAAEQALRDRQRSITESQGELQQALTESERLQAELQQAQRESDRLQAGLLQKQAEGRSTQLEAQEKVQQLEVEMNQLKAKVAETQNLLTSAKAKLKQRFLYAPVAGTISSLNIPNIGEVIQPGQTLAEIAPQDVPLVLSASLPNQEAGFVKTGMPVQVKLDAYPYQDYGIVSGKVTSISPDTKPDERLGAVYRVEVSLAQSYLTANHQNIKLKAGETATAEIIIRRRRIADLLLDPIRQLQNSGINL
ncbi:MAG: HlyD family efflux transporter periplasmic adaptor subunit [Microcoleus sp. SIO2G3]|nr:HlyD family efflux transporter periplasmic adaptor subunit [Microcoleus sp. SIO2G3]